MFLSFIDYKVDSRAERLIFSSDSDLTATSFCNITGDLVI